MQEILILCIANSKNGQNSYLFIPLLCIGFNCGEAVNFAIGDWFPLGAAASKRYAHLKMLPIIPYEELLCKEAVLIYKSSKVRSSKKKLEVTPSYRAIVPSFLHLMQFYKTSLSRLNSSRNVSSSSDTLLTSLTCSICHRDCYVAYLLCKKCYSYPICLFHGKTSSFYSSNLRLVISVACTIDGKTCLL